MSAPPKVSVLMPVHNGARFLRPAIESILAQSSRDFELLVVDDDSTDQSVPVARTFTDSRVRVIAGHGRRGLAGTLNLGLQSAASQYIARLDQDDVAHPDRIQKQAALLDHRPEVALVGSLARLIDEGGRYRGMVQRPLSAIGIRWYSLVENPLIHSTAMFRRDIALGIGGYDESLPLAEDYDLWGRILQGHTVENINETLIDYRRVSSSMMTTVESDVEGPRQQQLRAIMALLIRRRVQSELNDAGLSDDESALLATFTFGVERSRWRDFMVLFTRLRAQFEARWRERATSEPDYWRTLAGQYDAIAFRMTPASRVAAAGVYAHSWISAPRAALRLPWLRAGALLALGKGGRRRAANLRASG